MKAPHVRPCFARLRLWLCLSVVASVPQLTFAQGVPTASADAAFGRMMTLVTSAGQETIGFASSGTPVLNPSAATLATDGSASVSATRTAQLSNPVGGKYTVTAVGKTAAAKYGPLLIKSAKAVPLLYAGVAIYDLAKELGFEFVNTTGTFEVQKPPITAGGCGGIPPAKVPSTTSGCFGNYGGLYFIITSVVNTGSQCNIYGTCSNGGWPNTFLSNYPITGVTDTSTPSTEQAFLDAVAAKSGWPSTSNLSKAIAQAAPFADTQVAPDTVTITGPATSPGPVKTTVNADGTKAVSTTTYGHTYNTNNVTTGATTVTNNYNTSNVITSTSTETATPEAAPTKSQCETNPSSAGCADLGTAPTPDTMKKTTQAVAVSTVSFSSGGACPSPLTFSVIGQSYGVSYQPLCDQMFILRALFLAMAGVLAAYILADSFKV